MRHTWKARLTLEYTTVAKMRRTWKIAQHLANYFILGKMRHTWNIAAL